MPEITPTFLIQITLTIFLWLLWFVPAGWTFYDTRKHDLLWWERFLWTWLAMIPLLGIAFYLWSRGSAESAEFAHRQTRPFSTPLPATAPMNGRGLATLAPTNNGPNMMRATLSPVEYRQRQHPRHAVRQSQRPTGRAPEMALTRMPTPAPVAFSNAATLAVARQTQTPQAGWRLEVSKGVGRIVGNGELRFGRNIIGAVAQDETTIVLERDTTVSRQHVAIEVESDQLTLHNLSQRSYTWVDGQRLAADQSLTLTPEMSLRVGDTHLQLSNANAAIPSVPEHTVVVESGPHQGRRLALHQYPARIGRAPDCQIRLAEDARVSRHHAELFEQDGAIYIRDLDSTSGTLVNDHVVTTQQLQPSDTLQVGGSALRVVTI